MFGGRDEAMLDSSISSQGLLVCAGMKKSDIQVFFVVDHGEEHFSGMGLGVVVVHAVAGEPTHIDLMVRIIPLVYCQQ